MPRWPKQKMPCPQRSRRQSHCRTTRCTRIKILYALHDNELCVQDIANAVQLSQSAVSHQLRVLKDTKLVRFRRDGKTVYYALDDDHVRSILSLGMEHIEESLKGRYYL